MLKIFNKFLFVVLVTMSVSSLKAQDSKMLDVKVSIKTVQIQKIFESDVRIRLETTIKFCNLGDKSLIFLKEEDYPNFPGIVLADSRENLKARNYLTFDYFGEAVNTSEKWNILSTKLDTLKPSTDNFIILKANEITEFEREIVFYLPTEKSVSSYFPKKESWEKIYPIVKIGTKYNASENSFFARSNPSSLPKEATPKATRIVSLKILMKSLSNCA